MPEVNIRHYRLPYRFIRVIKRHKMLEGGEKNEERSTASYRKFLKRGGRKPRLHRGVKCIDKGRPTMFH